MGRTASLASKRDELMQAFEQALNQKNKARAPQLVQER